MTRIKITKSRLLEATIGKMLESYLDEVGVEVPGGVVQGLKAKYDAIAAKNPSDPRLPQIRAQMGVGIQQMAAGRPKGAPPPVPSAAFGEGIELTEAMNSQEIAAALDQLRQRLETETDPAMIRTISAKMQKGLEMQTAMAGGVPPPPAAASRQQSPQLLQQSSYGESYIRDLVGEIVEDTMLKRTRAGESQANVPVRVPMPRNPIASPPGGGSSMGPKELMGILNGIEQMQSLEDLSSQDKMALAQARDLMVGVFKGKSHKG